MTMSVPRSTLTTKELAKLSNFRRDLADHLDEALLRAGDGVIVRTVQYTAIGGEDDFMVDITGTPPEADTYDVGLLGAEGAAVVPAVWDFPNADPGDRTVTQFRVLTNAPLQAGDVFNFVLLEVTV